MNIYQKLIEVRKIVPYLQKESKGHQYNYVGSSQVLASVRQKMDELNLLLIPRVVGHQVATTEKTNSKGSTTSEYFTELDMEYTWVNAEDPNETITVPWYGQGIDTAGEKGVGKAMTYAEKYFLLKQFNIATDQDDPDSFQDRHTPKPAVVLADRAAMSNINKKRQSLGMSQDDLFTLIKIICPNNTDPRSLTAEEAVTVLNELDKKASDKSA